MAINPILLAMQDVPQEQLSRAGSYTQSAVDNYDKGRWAYNQQQMANQELAMKKQIREKQDEIERKKKAQMGSDILGALGMVAGGVGIIPGLAGGVSGMAKAGKIGSAIGGGGRSQGSGIIDALSTVGEGIGDWNDRMEYGNILKPLTRQSGQRVA